jgi:glutamyl-tRNA reductase
MHVTVVGLSHRTAPVEQREKAALSERETREMLRALLASPGVTEAAALSTCNRTEVYVATTDPTAAEATVEDALLAHTRISRAELGCARYAHRDDRAAAQLFRVTSSLDSMVLGESEIQGQVRGAWELAVEEGTAGPVLNQLFRQALEVGKRVRTDTRISHGPSSVPAVAVNMASQAFEDLSARRVLVIGAGQMAESVLASLLEKGVGEVVVVNRTVTTARVLASRVGGRGEGFDRLDEELAEADIVISSTDAPHHVLTLPRMEAVVAHRPARPTVIIDISVPRDVESSIAGLPGIVLHDIDDLERVVEANLNGRRLEAMIGERMVLDAVEGFSEWRSGLAAAPAIRDLREWAEEIRAGEVAKAASGWAALDDGDLERLDALTRAIVNKILHEPTVRAKAAVRNADGIRHLESLRHLFGLESEHEPQRSPAPPRPAAPPRETRRASRTAG